MTFDEYVAEIQRLAERDGATEPGKPYCDAESWRDSYDDGWRPEEAWAEECSAASNVLG